MASTTIMLEDRKSIGKTPETPLGPLGLESSASSAASMLKKPQLANEGQGHFDLLLQRKKNPSFSTISVTDLTRLHRQVLDEIVHHAENGVFLSVRDLGKILPNGRSEIDQALVCLQSLGIINCAGAERSAYYCPAEKFHDLRNQVRTLTVCSKIEREIASIVRESLLKLYPGALSSNSEGLLGSNDDSSFDIVFQFNSPVMGKQFFVANVFTRIPVTKQIVRCFSKKIRLACTESRQTLQEGMGRHHPRRGTALGMLICNMASQKAIETAKDHAISLLRFRDIQLCHSQVNKLVHLIQIMR